MVSISSHVKPEFSRSFDSITTRVSPCETRDFCGTIKEFIKETTMNSDEGRLNREKTVWDYKPWWCQPWSILLTGITIIFGSWLVFKIIWLTVLISIPILSWMGFFILVYPRLVLKSGLLDTQEEFPTN
jgi:hypothetical protein